MGKRLDGNRADSEFIGFRVLPDQREWLADQTNEDMPTVSAVIRELIAVAQFTDLPLADLVHRRIIEEANARSLLESNSGRMVEGKSLKDFAMKRLKKGIERRMKD